MKKIGIILTFAICFIACNKNTDIEDERLSSTSLNKAASSSKSIYDGAITELYLHQFYLEYELAILNERIEELLVEIENGDESKIPELEEAQQDHEEKSELYYLNLESIAFIRLPKAPVPNPCNDGEINCPVFFTFPNILSLLVAEPSGEISISIITPEGEEITELPYAIEEHTNLNGIYVYTMELPIEEGTLNISKQSPTNGDLLSYTIDFTVVE